MSRCQLFDQINGFIEQAVPTWHYYFEERSTKDTKDTQRTQWDVYFLRDLCVSFVSFVLLFLHKDLRRGTAGNWICNGVEIEGCYMRIIN